MKLQESVHLVTEFMKIKLFSHDVMDRQFDFVLAAISSFSFLFWKLSLNLISYVKNQIEW